MDTKIIKNSTDEHIDPAEADLQEELIREVKKLESATNDVKFQALTVGVADTTVTPAGHGCKGVQIMTAASTVSVGDEVGQPVLLIQNIWLPIPINNVGLLRFRGSAGGEVVYVISSN